jgi:hypothetical protein
MTNATATFQCPAIPLTPTPGQIPPAKLNGHQVELYRGRTSPRVNQTGRWLRDMTSKQRQAFFRRKGVEIKPQPDPIETSATSQGAPLQRSFLGAVYDYTLGVLENALAEEETEADKAKNRVVDKTLDVVEPPDSVVEDAKVESDQPAAKPKTEATAIPKSEKAFKTTKQLVDYAKRNGFLCTDQFENDCVGKSNQKLDGTLVLIGNDHSDRRGLDAIKGLLEGMRAKDVLLAETAPDDLNPAVCFRVPERQCIGIDVPHTALAQQYNAELIDATYARLEAFDPAAARAIKARLPNVGSTHDDDSLDSFQEYERLLNEAMDKIRPRIAADRKSELRRHDQKVQKASDRFGAEVRKSVDSRDVNFVKKIKQALSESRGRTVYCSLGLMHIAKIGRQFTDLRVFMLLPRSSLPGWVQLDG